MAVGAIPAAMLVYSLSRPGKDGQQPALTKFLGSFSYLDKEWEIRNTLRTAAIEQAAHDKHLFYNVDRNKHIELKYPEYVSLPPRPPLAHPVWPKV